jgi:signal transduction histidine kinase
MSPATQNDHGSGGCTSARTALRAAQASHARAPCATDELPGLRRRETLLILLNLGVLAALIGIHLAFAPYVGTSVRLAVGLFTGRCAMLVLELLWLRGRFGEPTAETVRRYAQISVWFNVAFACLASLVSGVPHSHYIVLMVLPTIAAAFRSTWTGLAAVLGVAIGVTFLYVGVYQAVGTREQRIDECFEAATDTLAYLAIAVVVRVLMTQLRAEQQRLRRSLVELEHTRDRLVAEEKLAAVGRLSAAIAHEIRNPVGMMASAAAAARQAGCAPAAREELYAIVLQESGHLERLTDDFLSFARQAELRRRPTSPRTTLEYLAAVIRPRASAAQFQVAVQCAADQEIHMDAALVHQALLNLAANAMEAAPPGSVVTLGAEPGVAGEVALFVANCGAPIPPEVRARLFEPFFTTKPRGTGLGLAISRKIAQAHGGDLRLTHNERDQVRFSLILPPVAAGSASRQEVGDGANSDC